MSRVVNLVRAWGPVVQAPLLVMREGFSPRYDLDRWSGVISRIGHSAEGASIRGCILVIPTTKGGWAFHDLLHKGIAPAGLVFGKLNPVMVQGAVLAGIPVAEGLTAQDLQTLASGEMVRLDPMARTLTVVALR